MEDKRTVAGSSGAQEARTLGLACLLAGLVALGTAAIPFSRTAPTGVAASLGALGVAMGAGLLVAADRVPPWIRHLVLLVASGAVSWCVGASTTDPGRVVTAYGYVWIALFVAWFHTRPTMAVHLVGIAAGFGIALLVADAPSAPQTWGFVLASVVGVAVVLNTLVGRLRRLADRDQLTGLLNRSAFATAAERAMARAERASEPLSLALIDLDGFKLVNDRKGHAAGDRLLVELGRSWTGAVRRGDVLGRHGGDEFVLLMPATTGAEAERVLGRLDRASGDGRWSAGVAQWEGEDLGRWLGRADAELYARKRGAAGRVV